MSHYSLAQKPKQLHLWASRMAMSIIDNMIEEPVLVYTGLSGISAATALSIVLSGFGKSCGMVYIRKKLEKSHGNPIESEIPNSFTNPEYIFVDDFICSGDTRYWCEEKLGCRFNWKALQKLTLPDVEEVNEVIKC